MNTTPDMISRADVVSSISGNQLTELHQNLCHPGITRLWHFVKTRNLPYSLDDVKRVIENCRICAQFKPRFVKVTNTLVKATRPFEKLSLDFKGPLPSTSNKKFLLVVVDEYSRFPFAFATHDTATDTVIRCLTTLFAIFGMPECVHSDRGTGFSSKQFRHFLLSNNVAQSFTTPYNPQGNGQVERYNGVLWNSLQMACRTRSLNVNCWEQVLPVVLHSMRSLLCTATNTTPHERLFKHERKTASGLPVPTWLMSAKTALLHYPRSSKYDPAVQEVDIVDVNPTYARVRLPSGREPLVSLRHLAPAGLKQNNILNNFEEVADPFEQSESQPRGESKSPSTERSLIVSDVDEATSNDNCRGPPIVPSGAPPERRCSSRIKRPPVRFEDYDLEM